MKNTASIPTISPFITQDDLCFRWQKSRMSIWRYRQQGMLPSYNLGVRGVRFRLSDVERIEQQSAR